MPRLKLPKPAKRKALMEAAAATANRQGLGRYGCVKKGYAMALRHVHVIRNKEARERQRRRWKIHDLYQFQIEALKKERDEAREALAKVNAPSPEQVERQRRIDAGELCKHGNNNCNACGF